MGSELLTQELCVQKAATRCVRRSKASSYLAHLTDPDLILRTCSARTIDTFIDDIASDFQH